VTIDGTTRTAEIGGSQATTSPTPALPATTAPESPQPTAPSITDATPPTTELTTASTDPTSATPSDVQTPTGSPTPETTVTPETTETAEPTEEPTSEPSDAASPTPDVTTSEPSQPTEPTTPPEPAPAVLSLTGAAVLEQPSVSGSGSLTVQVRNDGELPSTPQPVRVSLPDGVGVASISVDGTLASEGAQTCTLPEIGAGQEVTVRISLTATQDAADGAAVISTTDSSAELALLITGGQLPDEPAPTTEQPAMREEGTATAQPTPTVDATTEQPTPTADTATATTPDAPTTTGP